MARPKALSAPAAREKGTVPMPPSPVWTSVSTVVWSRFRSSALKGAWGVTISSLDSKTFRKKLSKKRSPKP